MNEMDEFTPVDHFNRLLHLWWLVTLFILLGGVLGFIVHRVRPPVYEATARYFVSIDTQKFPDIKVIGKENYQYNEDIALASTEGIIYSPEVTQAVLKEVKAQNIPLTEASFRQNGVIERKHAFWELQYRDPSPATAQTIVNIWATIGYQTMIKAQQQGSVQNYVMFHEPVLATLPKSAQIYNRNQLMLAGILIGLVTGIFVTDLAASFLVKKNQNAGKMRLPA